MVRKRLRKKALPALAVAVSFSLMCGFSAYAKESVATDDPVQTETEAPKSQAIIEHEPVAYTVDYSGEATMIRGGDIEEMQGSWKELPTLQPGDTVTIIPNLPAPDYDKPSVSGVGGVVFHDPYSSEDRGPIKVLSSVAVGQAPEGSGHGNTFIRKIEITGTEPVKVFTWGGGGYTEESFTEAETGKTTKVSYGMEWLQFVNVPAYAPLGYEYLDSSGSGTEQAFSDEVKEDIRFYAVGVDGQGPDAVWASDAIYNLANKGSDDMVPYEIARPHLEGYYLDNAHTGIYTNGSAYNMLAGKDGGSQPKFADGAETTEVYPLWKMTVYGNSVDKYDKKVDEDAWVSIAFRFLGGRTLTLDANGGTIYGYEDRVFEANNNNAMDTIKALEEAGAFVPDAREGYHFVGWSTEKDGELLEGSITDYVQTFANSSAAERSARVAKLYAVWHKLDHVNMVYPTTKKDGNIEYYKCDACDKYFWDADGDNEIEDKSEVILPKIFSGWMQLDKYWFYFDDETGEQVIGWKKIKNMWYYFDKKMDGAMVTGWFQSGKKWYYFDPKDGFMKTGWVKSGKSWYYMDKKDGFMKTNAWVQDGKDWYYFKADGTMAANEWCKGYWLNKNGTCTYGGKASWKKDKIGWYYIDNKGWYAKGETLTIDGKKYTFNAEGYLK